MTRAANETQLDCFLVWCISLALRLVRSDRKREKPFDGAPDVK